MSKDLYVLKLVGVGGEMSPVNSSNADEFRI